MITSAPTILVRYMLRPTKQLLLLVVVVSVLFCAALYERSVRAEAATLAAIDHCGYISKQPIDCWTSLLREEFKADGIEATFQIFETIYQRHEVFADTGCHAHAHRIGDMAYYYDYLEHEDLDTMHFPKSANACGYGFYHGFIEHLIQDHPDTAFVTDVCTKLTERLTEIAPAMGRTCYHGAGHGFVLSKADQALDPQKWNFNFFTDEAVEQCSHLPAASAEEKSECRQGVYNVINNWMEEEEYGFVYPSTTPFVDCDSRVSALYQGDCYYEMAQKIPAFSNNSVREGLQLIETGERTEFYPTAFGTLIGGLIQNNPDEAGVALLAECRVLDKQYLRPCIRSIVGGQFEHGTPGAEYDIPQQFCTDEPMDDVEQTYCLEMFTQKLHRFRSEAEIADLCHDGALNQLVCTYVQNQKGSVGSPT
jgi:hypothetical protein